MAKYYVQSGRVRLTFSASSALQAAVKAFEWVCRRQSLINAPSALEHVQEAERQGCELEEVVWVNERGFDRFDSRVFDTLDVLVAWQRKADRAERYRQQLAKNGGNRDGGNRDGGNRDGGNRDGGNRDGTSFRPSPRGQ